MHAARALSYCMMHRVLVCVTSVGWTGERFGLFEKHVSQETDIPIKDDEVAEN